MRRHSLRRPRLLLPLLLAMVASGCAGDRALSATTVLAHSQCQGLEPGLTRVDYRALAGIRGSTLLSMTRPEPEPEDDLLLVAISRGQQPTPGYTLALARVSLRGTTAMIEVRWKTPESGAVLAQMITHPCLVVGLPAGNLARVEARDQSGTFLGGLDL